MIKKFIFILFAVLCTACSHTDRTTLNGKINAPLLEGKYVYLYDAFHNDILIDSIKIINQKITYNFPDSLAIYNLKVKAAPNDPFPIVLPFVAGEGSVYVVLGNVVVTSGTPSNDSLQDFLLASDQLFTKSLKSTEVAEVKNKVKEVLIDQINLNKFSIVSAYILYTFKSNFTEQEYIEIKSKLEPHVSTFLD